MEDFNIGDKVIYTKTGEKGMVKQVDAYTCHVVYHCDDDWENYAYYTSMMTKKSDLIHGWDKTQQDAKD